MTPKQIVENSWLVFIASAKHAAQAIQYDFREIRDREINHFILFAPANSRSELVLGCTSPIFYNASPHPCRFDIYLPEKASLKLLLFHHYQKNAPIDTRFHFHLAKQSSLDCVELSLGKTASQFPRELFFDDESAQCRFSEFRWQQQGPASSILLKKQTYWQEGCKENPEKEISIPNMDKNQLFYLVSRGIGSKAAQALLLKAAIHDILKQLPAVYAVELERFLELKTFI